MECEWCYLDKGVPAVHSLSRGQSFGHALSGSHEAVLSQTPLQLFGSHLRWCNRHSQTRSSELLSYVKKNKNYTYIQKLAGHVEMGRCDDVTGLEVIYYGAWNYEEKYVEWLKWCKLFCAFENRIYSTCILLSNFTLPRWRMAASSLEISQESFSVNMRIFRAERKWAYSLTSSRPSHLLFAPWWYDHMGKN